MPELPEVETVRRGLEPFLVGRRLTVVEVRRPDLRIPFPDDFAARLQGRQVIRLGRRAKYILVFLDDGQVWIIHLGMSGRIDMHPPEETQISAAPVPHEHVSFTTDTGFRFGFVDPRRFGLMTLCPEAALAEHPLFARLGPEPLANTFNGAVLSAALHGRASPIKAALLDQSVVAGLGNIYVCEALYYAGISPRRKAATVAGRRAERLAGAIRRVLEDALAAGGSSLRDYRHVDGDLGYFQTQFAVYGRTGKPCPDRRCETGVRRIVQSNRSTFFCACLQR